LVKHFRGWAIGEVDCRLIWGPEPSTQGNCDDELGAKSQLESLQPDEPQSLVEGCSCCQIRLLGKRATCGRTMSQWMEVPSPKQISATVRACLAKQYWLIDNKSLLES